jgi:hypothetical protein
MNKISKFILILFLFIGLHIVYTLDEVDFVQNLIFYIEQSYMIPVSLKKRKQKQNKRRI